MTRTMSVSVLFFLWAVSYVYFLFWFNLFVILIVTEHVDLISMFVFVLLSVWRHCLVSGCKWKSFRSGSVIAEQWSQYQWQGQCQCWGWYYCGQFLMKGFSFLFHSTFLFREQVISIVTVHLYMMSMIVFALLSGSTDCLDSGCKWRSCRSRSGSIIAEQWSQHQWQEQCQRLCWYYCVQFFMNCSSCLVLLNLLIWNMQHWLSLSKFFKFVFVLLSEWTDCLDSGCKWRSFRIGSYIAEQWSQYQWQGQCQC